jgi:DDE superfamily endonuclease
VNAAAEFHPDKRIGLWFMDEARVGQKGRTGFRWWLRGERPRGLCDRRFEWAYLFDAVRPATGGDFALVLPEASTGTMQVFLDHFADALDEDAHAVLVLDRAGWHGSRRLAVPPGITLAPLPAYAPEHLGQCPKSGRADLAVPARALPRAPPARRPRRHRRRPLRGVERAHARPPPLPLHIPLDRKGQFIGSAVLHRLSGSTGRSTGSFRSQAKLPD